MPGTRGDSPASVRTQGLICCFGLGLTFLGIYATKPCTPGECREGAWRRTTRWQVWAGTGHNDEVLNLLVRMTGSRGRWQQKRKPQHMEKLPRLRPFIHFPG